MKNRQMTTNLAATILILGLISLAGCSGGPLTTREKGAGVGALGGAAVGGLIRSAVGPPRAGAAIGGGWGVGGPAPGAGPHPTQGKKQKPPDKKNSPYKG